MRERLHSTIEPAADRAASALAASGLTPSALAAAETGGDEGRPVLASAPATHPSADVAAPAAAPVPPRASAWRRTAPPIGLAIAGAAVLALIWQLVAMLRPDLPAPGEVAAEAGRLLSSPLDDNGPNDKGLALLLGASLLKVFAGFLVAALVGIPAGFAIGMSAVARKSLNPVVQLLRPVSPLAWFPIALVIFRDARTAGVFTIAVTALWPTLINTAVGVAGVPQDHRNVARVFRFGRVRYLRHVVLPYSMVAVFTGLRLSMGIGWMVIVATEMLSGGTGIGFFVWDSYNNGNLAAVVVAILLIGIVGLLLDAMFQRLARSFDYVGKTA